MSNSARARPPEILRVEIPLTVHQVRAWAAKVQAHVRADPASRAPRFWAVYLGLSGPNLDRVLVELGEPPAPRRPPVLALHRAARAHFRLLEVS